MKRLICTTLSILLLFSLCSCSAINSSKTKRFTSSFLDLFDTASSVVAYDTSQEEFDSHLSQFHDKLEEYYKLYDIYNTYDGLVNLCTVNAQAGKAPVEVDEKILDLLEWSRQVYEITDGKTNICLGAVLSLWHDCRQSAIDEPDSAHLPSDEELKSASLHTDINDLILDKGAGTVYFADSELKLDVGAVAKGYAVQRVCEWAQENLWQSGVVSIGGNVYTFGSKGDDGKTPWSIGVENPDTTSQDYLLTLSLTDLSVVTSGDYQRYFTYNGKKYCHIIDPQTLYPAQYVRSVTVITNDSALGDAMSTALFNMTIDEGKALVESMQNVEAVWVDSDLKKTFSSGFEAYIKN